MSSSVQNVQLGSGPDEEEHGRQSFVAVSSGRVKDIQCREGSEAGSIDITHDRREQPWFFNAEAH